MSIVDEILKSYRKVAEADAPEFFKAVSELSEKAGVSAPTIHFQNTEKTLVHSHLGKMFDYLIGVLPKGKGMIVGHKVLEIFGASDPNAPISEELRAVIAHELGHIKHNDLGSFGMKKFALCSPFVGIAAGIGALAIFEHYHKKSAQKKQLEEKLPGEEGYSHELEQKDRKHPLGWLITVAKYLAAGALGLTAGLFAFRALHHHMEFRADKFSATLMGSGKPLADALKKFGEAGMKESASAFDRLRAEGVPESKISNIRKIDEFIKQMIHPPMAERIERLSRL